MRRLLDRVAVRQLVVAVALNLLAALALLALGALMVAAVEIGHVP